MLQRDAEKQCVFDYTDVLFGGARHMFQQECLRTRYVYFKDSIGFLHAVFSDIDMSIKF